MKTRKFIFLFSVLVAILLIPSAVNAAEEFSFDNIIYKVLTENTVEMSGYEGNPTIVSIPQTVINNVKTYTVTSIGGSAFSQCSSLESIVIPDSVNTMGSYCFSGCTNLTSITLSKNIKEIPEFMFNTCGNLKSINIPNSVTTIGENAFQSCSNLQSVTMPNSLTTIKNRAFWGCKSLESISIPNGAKTIGEIAFYDCTSLKNVSITDTVTSIGKGAFQYCMSLETVNIPTGLKTIEEDVFSWCNKLTAITIPDGLTTIGRSSFFRCYDLKKVIIPESVTLIDSGAFNGCKGLKEIVIYNPQATIGSYAFSTTYKNPETNSNYKYSIIYGYPDSTAYDHSQNCGYNIDFVDLYSVNYNLKNITNSKISYANLDLLVTLTANEGYKLPENIKVKIGGKEVTDFTYNKSTGEVTIEKSKFTDDVEIEAVAIKLETPSEDKKDETNLDDNITNTENPTNPVDNTGNPKTGDSVVLFTRLLIIAAIGMIITTKLKKNIK